VLSLPSLTPKDLDDLKFGIENNVDFVALSFVRSAHDVHRLKAEIKKLNAETPVIAKLEKPQAIKHLGEIMNAADGVMVARGDLGVEMPLEEVPIIQKNIITVAKEYHKPVITATQMLESMTQNQTPTRAEVSDVANAIFDGTDCVMLSGETASGMYPVEAVKMMSRIIRTSEEKTKLQPPIFDMYGSAVVEFADAVAEAAIEMGKDIDARVIACFTQSGLTARLISKHRSSIPIVAFTPRRDIINRLVLLRGVVPHYIPIQKSVDQLINEVERIFKEEKVAKIGDNIVIVASAPISVRGDTNMLKLHTIT
jgi:pyruvate kinase